MDKLNEFLFNLKEKSNKKYSRGIDKCQIKEIVKEAKLNSDVTIIDVRSPLEFKEGHIDGAILIPEYEIQYTIESIIRNKDQKIYAYCSSGIRSERAVKKLERLGYTNSYNLGGIID